MGTYITFYINITILVTHIAGEKGHKCLKWLRRKHKRSSTREITRGSSMFKNYSAGCKQHKKSLF